MCQNCVSCGILNVKPTAENTNKEKEKCELFNLNVWTVKTSTNMM